MTELTFSCFLTLKFSAISGMCHIAIYSYSFIQILILSVFINILFLARLEVFIIFGVIFRDLMIIYIFEMSPLMFGQLSLLFEGFPAVLTLEGFVPGVNS